MVSAQALISLFRQALKENWGYIWGTAGERWTAAKQAVLEKTTDSDRAQGRKYGSKWIGHTVVDCSGLFSWAFKKLGGSVYHGSDTMYRKYCVNKGELKKGKRADGAALKPGTAVFVWNGKKYSHVGLFTGDNTVIEAMGTVNGVTTSKVTAGKWTHWGELAGVDYNSQFRIQNSELSDRNGTPQRTDVIPSEAEGSPPVSRTTLRKGSKGETVRELQSLLDKLGYDLGPCGADGDYGKATEAAVRKFQSDHRLAVDGVCGPATFAELEKAAAALGSGPAEKTYTVRITGLSRARAEEIVEKYGGVTAEE